MIPQFNDDHQIDNNFQQIKFFIEEVEADIYKFIGPTRNRKAGRRARKKLIKIRQLVHKVSIGIMHQGQDFDSEY